MVKQATITHIGMQLMKILKPINIDSKESWWEEAPCLTALAF